MARVRIASQPWGMLFNGDFTTPEYLSTVPEITTLAGADVTVYEEETGTDEQPTLQTNQYGQIPGWIEEGSYLRDGNRVEAVSGRPGGRVVLSPSGDTTGVVDSARLAAAVTALGGAGTIELTVGIFYWSTTAMFAATSGLTLVGQGGRTAGVAAATRVEYVPSTGPAINAKSTKSLRIADIQFVYSHASFASKFIDFGHGSGVAPETATYDSSECVVERCDFDSGGSGVTGCTAFLSFSNAHSMTVRHCRFGRCVCAIRGVDGSEFSNRILIESCNFNQTGGVGSSQAPIQSADKTWTVRASTFECIANGNAGAYSQAAGTATGLTFDGCWFGDAGTSGTWLAFGAASASKVTGCYLSGGAIGISFTAGAIGAKIECNHFLGNGSDALAKGVDVAAGCSDIIVEANKFQPSGGAVVTVPITVADSPPASRFQFISGDATTPTMNVTSKIHADNYLALKEISAPGGAGPDRVRIYAVADGGGLTDLNAIFQDSTLVTLAQEV